MKSNKKILIAAGGTGGHLYPGIVLAKELCKKECDVLFVLRAKDTGFKSLEIEGFQFVEISCAPVLNQSFLSILKGLWLNFYGIFEGLRIVGKFSPDCVIGFGAYVSVPVVIAAFLKRIPILLHEQNLLPGWSNRCCSIFAKKVAISFKETEKYFSGRSIFIGNLIREELFKLDRNKALKFLGLNGERLTIFIFGGSGGAKSVNEAVSQSLEKFSSLKDKIQFLHLTGSREQTEKLIKKYHDCQLNSIVLDYSHQMADCYAVADLIVSRAGASTISELIATKVPAILVPYPYAASDHQSRNADILQSIGSAIVLHESENFSIRLVDAILQIVQSKEKLTNMRDSYKKFPVALEQASSKLANIVIDLAEENINHNGK